MKKMFFIPAVFLLFNLSLITAETKPEIKVQLGHSNDVKSVAFSPDGRLAVSGSYDKTVKLWDVTSGKELRSFDGHSAEVSAVAFSPDGRFVLSGSWDKTVRLWEAASGKELRIFTGHAHYVISVAFSPDGRYALSGSVDKTLRLWDVESGREIWTRDGRSDRINAVMFLPDGKRAFSVAYNALILWDAAQGKAIRTFEKHSTWSEIRSLAISPDSRQVLTASEDRSLKLWDIGSGTEVRTFKGHSGSVSSVAFSPDGRSALSGSDDWTMRLWDVGNGETVRTFKGHTFWIKSVAFSPDGRLALSGSGDKTLKLWDVAGGKHIRTFKGYSDGVGAVAFSPDGRRALSGSGDKILKLWDIATGKEIRTFKGHSQDVSSVAFSPDAALALSGSWGEMKLWDVESGKYIRSFTGHSEWVNAVAFSPDGKHALSGSDDKTLRVWEVKSGKETRTLKRPSMVRSACFSPDGKFLLSGEFGDIKIWDMGQGKAIQTFTGKFWHETAVFSPDGKHILTGSFDKKVKLLDVAGGVVVKTFEGHSAEVKSVAFFPDGKHALSGSWDKTVRIWDVSGGTVVRILKGHSGSVGAVAVSPDGRYVLSGSADSTMKLWDAGTGECIYSIITAREGGDYLCWTPDGYFTGTAWAMRNLVHVVDGLGLFAIDQFFDTYFRPDIIAARVRGEDTGRYVRDDIRKGIRTPPEISLGIRTRDGAYRGLALVGTRDSLIEEGRVNVQVTARDTGGGIKGVRLYNNGKLAGENMNAASRGPTIGTIFTAVFDVPLSAGENVLTAVGFSDDMTESPHREALVPYAAAGPGKPDMHVLGIGINEYRNGAYNLNYCVADVNGFVGALVPRAKKLFETVHVKVLADREATRGNFLNACEEIKRKIRPQDVFVFFYAGHGIALDAAGPDGKAACEFYYVLSGVTQMTDGAKTAAEGISGSEMKKILSEIKATKQIMFVDACNSGAFANQFAMRGAAEESALMKLSRATGSVILASTTKEQFAAEFKELKHGVFTYVVIDALSGRGALPNGQLTAAGLKAFVDDKIPEYTKKYKGDEQYPTTFLWGQDFPIGMK